jgi:hypothetical protein
MSATPDSTLANPELLIADLQRQLAQCRAERDEALQREAATAEVLQVINSSPGDLAPVFDAMLEKALRLCNAAFGTLFIRDGEFFHAAATRGLPAQLEYFVQNSFKPSPGGFFERAGLGETTEHIADLGAARSRMAQEAGCGASCYGSCRK